MNYNNLNTLFVESIKQHLPVNYSVAKYLQEKLLLGRESAYRRIRGDIPFTIEELARIAIDLNLSLDTLLKSDSDTDNNFYVSFKMPVALSETPQKLIEAKLKNSVELLKQLTQAKQYSLTVALNRLPLYFYSYPLLAKLYYCFFLLAREKLAFASCFADVLVPDHILELYKINHYYFSKLKNITCILQHNILQDLVNEIRCIKKMGFLSQEDVKDIQRELYDLFKSMETRIFEGANNSTFYLSYTPVGTSSAQYEFDNNQCVQYWVYYESPIMIYNNPRLYKLSDIFMKGRLRYASLLTKSNNILQAEVHQSMLQTIKSLDEK